LVSPEHHAEDPTNVDRTSVVFGGHPLFSSDTVKGILNYHRRYGNSNEELLTGDIRKEVFRDISNAAFKTGFPMDMLIFACDAVTRLDQRSEASDAEGLANQYISYVKELQGSLNRQPTKGEVLAAGMLESASQVQDLIQQALSAPREDSTGSGAEIIFNRVHEFIRIVDNAAKSLVNTENNVVGTYNIGMGTNTDKPETSTATQDTSWKDLGPDGENKPSPTTKKRTNKEVVRYFERRIRGGSDIFQFYPT
jgi:hypothetical protein